MPYILKKTNGNTLTTVQDASVDKTTSLIFVGRNYSGYGQTVEENFVRLLENFANTSAPGNPIQGQLWFNNAPNSRRLLVSYDGTNFRDVVNVPYSDSAPLTPSAGDLWWDSINQQIKVYDGITNVWIASQPDGGGGSRWDFSKVLDNNLIDQYSFRGYLRTTPVVEIANANFVPDSSTGLNTAFPVIKRGINLPGVDSATGSSTNSTSTGYLLWGTASDALKAQKVDITATSSAAIHYLTFATATSGTQTLYARSNVSYNPNTDVLTVTASSALYADIAERYEADAVYEPGTVLMLGGEKEVTLAREHATIAVAGIVSTKPAYMLNSEAGSDETHPFIALKGRVPCKICGPVKKGDLLVSSGYKHGYATKKQDHDSSDAVIGKALQDHAGPFGVIEVKV